MLLEIQFIVKTIPRSEVLRDEQTARPDQLAYRVLPGTRVVVSRHQSKIPQEKVSLKSPKGIVTTSAPLSNRQFISDTFPGPMPV